MIREVCCLSPMISGTDRWYNSQVSDSVIKKETMFDASRIEEHTASVIEEVLKRLADQRKPFKYVGE